PQPHLHAGPHRCHGGAVSHQHLPPGQGGGAPAQGAPLLPGHPALARQPAGRRPGSGRCPGSQLLHPSMPAATFCLL
ncbi:hypothetical protein HaLaN_24339, partial [Haematococcus lacustris]